MSETAAAAAEAALPPIDPFVEAGLRFGSMVRIDSDYQAERYNRVLAEFGLERVARAPFHVDISGFSLEVAQALGDMDYLDPNGANRRFVILTNRQAKAPLVNSTFSCEKAMLQYFLAANEAAIGKITLHNVLFGEIENYAYRFEKASKVVGLRHVVFDCHALDGFFESQEELRGLVRRFADPADAGVRHDPARIDRMIALSRAVGDVRGTEAKLVGLSRPWPSAFSTRLFGGATFLDVGGGTGTAIGDPERLGPEDGTLRVVDRRAVPAVLSYLRQAGHLDGFSAERLSASGFLVHRMRTLAAHLLMDRDPETDGAVLASERGIENAIRRNIDFLCADAGFSFLSTLWEKVEQDPEEAKRFFAGQPPERQVLAMRARPNDDASSEVNRLLAHVCDFDLVTLFAHDKDAVYRRHADASPTRRAYALALLKALYVPDATDPDRKTRLKAGFFG